MSTPVLILMTVLFFVIAVGIFFLFQKRKYVWIPSMVFIDMGLFMLAIPTLMPDAAHGWDDLGYVILGIFLILFAIALAIVVGLILMIRKKKTASDK